LGDLDTINRKILETIVALSTIPGVSSRRGVTPEEVTEKLELSDREYKDRVEDLKSGGLLQVSTGWVAVPTSKGRRVLQECNTSMFRKIWRYISDEYKNSPVKTLASTLAIVIILYGFVIYIFNNFMYTETSPLVIDSSSKTNQVTDNRPLNVNANVSSNINRVKFDSAGETVTESNNTIAAPIVEPKSINFSGKGKEISQKFSLANGLTIFAMNYSSSNNSWERFEAEIMNSDGTNKQTLAYIMEFQGGHFNGAKALEISTSGDYKLNIETTGSPYDPWTVDITQPRPQTAQNVPVSFRGMGQQVSQFFTLRPGPASFKLNHDGEDSILVTLLDLKGNDVDDVAHEYGVLTNASKSIAIKDGGIYCLDIDTNGNWKIDVNQ